MSVVVVGAGPAGLMAAETIAFAGIPVTVVDHMPSAGRKFLMAGRGGLNLTHSEPLDAMLSRYRPRAPLLLQAVRDFPPEAVRRWCEDLGQPTFVGSSGRVFPVSMKASPLLRAWLGRLGKRGVAIETRRRVVALREGNGVTFEDGGSAPAQAVVLACGGASWPRLGSTGAWTGMLGDIAVNPLRPANCGFAVRWSKPFRTRHVGSPVKRIAVSFGGQTAPGEAVVTTDGIEGGAIYAVSGLVRDAIERDGSATVRIDLRPDLTRDILAERVNGPRRGQSLSTFLRKSVGLAPVAVGIVQEALHAGSSAPPDLASLIKSLPLVLHAPLSLARAISTAGGVNWEEISDGFMLTRRPGVFAAGEMLDWEAPTGGYLLQASFSTGVAAGRGVLAWLGRPTFP